MADKYFKTIEEQIEILRSRGLTINDEPQTRDFLLHNNYYRISGYSLTLRKNDVFFNLQHSKTLLTSIILTTNSGTSFSSILK